MIKNLRWLAWVAVLAGLLSSSCTSVRPTRFVNSGFDFAYVQRVAVLPLENMSSDRQAGERASRLLITALLASGAVDVVEPGEVLSTLNRQARGSLSPTTEQIIALGKSLSVQAIITGSVSQADLVRAGTVRVPVVTIDLHMVEVETGAAVWATTHTEKGSGFGSQVFGTGSPALSETMRECTQKLVEQLLQ